MIDLDGVEYVIAFWYVRGWADGREADWLAVAYRATKDAHPMVQYRHRYYADEELFEKTDDVKNFYSFVLADGDTDDRAIEVVDQLVQAALIDQGFCRTRLPWKLKDLRFKRVIRGTQRDFYDELVKMPFVHKRMATADEKADIEREREEARKGRN